MLNLFQRSYHFNDPQSPTTLSLPPPPLRRITLPHILGCTHPSSISLNSLKIMLPVLLVFKSCRTASVRSPYSIVILTPAARQLMKHCSFLLLKRTPTSPHLLFTFKILFLQLRTSTYLQHQVRTNLIAVQSFFTFQTNTFFVFTSICAVLPPYPETTFQQCA